jgi:hypothetical protein
MAKRHVKNSHFMKAIRDVHSFFQEESLKVRNNQPVLPHTAILEHVFTVLKISKNPEFETCNLPGKKVLFLLGVVIIITQAKKCMENNFTNIDMDEI